MVQKSKTNPNRDFVDDGVDVPEARRRTATQKVIHLELMLGQIANFCPVISRNTIIKSSTSIQSIWQSISQNALCQLLPRHFEKHDHQKQYIYSVDMAVNQSECTMASKAPGATS